MPAPWGNKPQYGDFKVAGAAEGRPRLLGEGSFGKTYEARRENIVAGSVIAEPAALKVLNPTLLASANKRVQFVQELMALAKFKHPNLIHIISCGEHEGEVFLAMELCAGGDLAGLVKQFGRLPERVAAMIGLQVAAGLRAMHEKHHMVHRDIKPSNIMLVDEMQPEMSVDELVQLLEDRENLCRIVDFGLVGTTMNANVHASAAETMVQQRFVGSPMYSSPEQILQKPVDGRTDIYALGMTLWFLVQGRGPLLDARGDELKSPHEAMDRHLRKEEHEPDLPATLSVEFRAILGRMVSKQPADRYATAKDLHTALERYLEKAAQVEQFRLTESREALEAHYLFEKELARGSGRKRYQALDRVKKERCRLTIVEDYGDRSRVRSDHNKAVEKLCDQARKIRHPNKPATLLEVRQVLRAADALAYAEEEAPRLSLADLLKARQAAKQPVPFPEAVAIFHPVAEALDFLVNQGWDKIFLPCEEVWLGGAGSAAMPLGEWQALDVKFSGMGAHMDGERDSSASQTMFASSSMTGSFMSADAARHPVSAFLRLVYRVLAGKEAADVADYLPSGYEPIASLGTRSNNLIKELLCRQKEWSALRLILNELCANEAVLLDPEGELPPGVPLPAASHGMSTRGKSTGIAQSGSHGTAPHSPLRTPVSSRDTAGRQPSPRSTDESVPLGSGPLPAQAAAAEFCEVVSPGIIADPKDWNHTQQKVRPVDWKPNGMVFCDATQRWLRLPAKLESLIGDVTGPGRVRSPFADERSPDQVVPWSQWQPRTEILCAETGRRFALPELLIYPEGIIPPTGTGVIVSPFEPTAKVNVPPESWRPGVFIRCPSTEHIFVLPASLPPLEALIDREHPGRFVSPFDPAKSIELQPCDWVAGRRFVIPGTEQEIAIPKAAESLAAEAKIVDGASRTVETPFKPGHTFVVPAAQWKRGGVISCPTGRSLKLPQEIPPLTGQVMGDEAGVIRSPFTMTAVKVPLDNWAPGKVVTCPVSKEPFLLPASLPMPDGIIDPDDTPGRIRSPYQPDAGVKVEPARWITGEVVHCPATGLQFRLPPKLPLLEALVTKGRPGFCRSPFARDAKKELQIDLDDWVPGGQFPCPDTERVFELPKDLDEWLKDGSWVARRPGWIRSPFRDGREFELSEKQWKPGAKHTYSHKDQHGEITRSFSVPVTADFPSLALEKAAVKFARAEPESDEKAAAAALSKAHPEAAAALIRSIWQRHNLDTEEKRLTWLEVGEAIPGKPGWIRSPYENKPEVQVPPADWVEAGATALCPATGQRFLLPPSLPMLVGTVESAKPGMVASPFAPDKPFRIETWQWNGGEDIRCEHTGHHFLLPDHLPAQWLPVARLVENRPGSVFNPFSKTDEAMPVLGADWEAGKVLEKRGRKFRLPDPLPPLSARSDQAAKGKVESPYADGHWVVVSPDNWVAGGSVVCGKTGRAFLLPVNLADTDDFEGIDPRSDGTIQSPYKSRKRITVLPAQWQPDGEVICEETGRRFTLPDAKNLPPLLGSIDPARPCEVQSPFAAGAWMSVAADDWTEGRRVKCSETGREFVLPAGLSLPVAQLVAGKPGAVLSPFGKHPEITVPPDHWQASDEIECRAAKRKFRLPDKLPSLEGSIVPGKALIVRSPFSPKTEIAIALDDWQPGFQVVCPDTQRTFVLPQRLDDPVLPAKLIEGRPGWIIDPFTTRDLQAPGSDWEENRIIRNSDGRQIQLPAKLPPLIAKLVEGKPGHIHSPYLPEGAEPLAVAAGKWQPAAIVKCRTKRPIQLPDDLPPLPVAEKKPLVIPWGILTSIAACFLIGGWAASVYLNPSKPPPSPPPPPPPQPVPGKNLAQLVDEFPNLTAPADKLANLQAQFDFRKTAEDFTGDYLKNVLDLAGNETDSPAARLADDSIQSILSLESLKTSTKPELQDVRKIALIASADRLFLNNGGKVDEPFITALLAAYREGCPGIADRLSQHIAQLAYPLFSQVIAEVQPPDKSKLITLAKQSSDKAVAAKAAYLEAAPKGKEWEKIKKSDTEQPAPEITSAYLAAAKNLAEHDKSAANEAAQWLTANIIAKLVPGKARTIYDPYTPEKELPQVAEAKWKPGNVLPEHLLKLPMWSDNIVAVFTDGKNIRPADGKDGTLTNPADGTTITVPAKFWYPGAKYTDQVTGLVIVVPDNIKLMPVLVNLDDVKKEGLPVVISPVTKGKLTLKWQNWHVGAIVTEAIDGQDRKIGILAEGKEQGEIDPKLSCTEAHVIFAEESPIGKSTDIPPKFYCEAKSPYTGKMVRVDPSLWLPGGPAPDDIQGPNGSRILSFTLPQGKLEAIPGIAIDDEKGWFSYWKYRDASAPDRINIKEAKIIDFRNFEIGGQLFKATNRSLVFRTNTEKTKGVHPVTGGVIPFEEVKEIVRNNKVKPEGIDFSRDFENLGERSTPPSPKPPDPDPKPPVGPVPPVKPPVIPPSTPPPTPPPSVDPGGKKPSQPPSITVPSVAGSGLPAKSFNTARGVFFKKEKDGSFQTNRNANLGSNGEEAAKDLTRVLRGDRRISGDYEVKYNPSTNGFYIAPKQ